MDQICITRKQKIGIILKNKANEISERLGDRFPQDNIHSFEECYTLFFDELDEFLSTDFKYKRQGWNAELFCIYRRESPFFLDVEYYRKFGVIVFYFRYYFTETKYEKLEIIRFSYTEYKKAVVFIGEIFNEMSSEMKELQEVLQEVLDAIINKKLNPKVFEIAVSSIKAICMAEENNMWIYSFFSETEAFILVSHDGKNTYLFELSLLCCNEKLPLLMKLIKNPEEYISEDKKMTCIKLCKITKDELLYIFEHTDIDERKLDWMD